MITQQEIDNAKFGEPMDLMERMLLRQLRGLMAGVIPWLVAYKQYKDNPSVRSLMYAIGRVQGAIILAQEITKGLDLSPEYRQEFEKMVADGGMVFNYASGVILNMNTGLYLDTYRVRPLNQQPY